KKSWYENLLWPGTNVLEHADRLAAEGNIDAAIATYQKAVQLEPLRFEARWNLASLLARTNQFDAALEQYQFILDQWSHDRETQLAMVDVLTTAGRLDEAEKTLNELMATKPDDAE